MEWSEGSVEIVRAGGAQIADALLLLGEYYEAVAVMVRDTPDEVRGYAASTESDLWMAYVRGTPAGCVLLRPLAGIAGAAECKRLYVREVFRGRGIAGRLLDEMERRARARGVRAIYLDSMDSLEGALRLYRARGYAECERYNSNPQATIFLRRTLADEAGR